MMENNYIQPSSRPYFLNFKNERESKINSLINNLKINQVKDDSMFIETSERIKREILINPVEIGKPKLVDFSFEERALTMEQSYSGFSKNHYHHQVSFTFSGDKELFSHIPEGGFSYGNLDRGLIIPNSNTLTIYIDLPELNPDRAVEESYKLLSMTMQFVKNNNQSLQDWTIVIKQKIDDLLKLKREELIRIFGNE